MNLFISKDIEDKAGVKAARAGSEKTIDEWKADVISVNRRKVIVFLNEKTGLTFFCYRPTERDFKHLADLFKEVLGVNAEALNIPFAIPSSISVYKGESKSAFEKIKERLLSFSDLLTDDDRYLSYISYLMNSKKTGGESPIIRYSSECSLPLKERALLLKIKSDGNGKDLSLLIPSYFTLESLKDCIDTVFSLSEGKRYDFTYYDPSSRYSALEYYYRPELFRAMDDEMDSSLKRKECLYALARSSMLSTLWKKYPELVYRHDFNFPERFFISFDSAMENISIKTPMVLSIKWADEEIMNKELRRITS